MPPLLLRSVIGNGRSACSNNFGFSYDVVVDGFLKKVLSLLSSSAVVSSEERVVTVRGVMGFGHSTVSNDKSRIASRARNVLSFSSLVFLHVFFLRSGDLRPNKHLLDSGDAILEDVEGAR